ncbi:hypothetical protein [Phytohabitans rumicis]|uniref:N-acetyltransferase domain-containing protein n=1 Tax=Phytohabitans rumicis TaxID=1076125 RepID=A0A6V8L2X5_9ACTN|nr:hypothetical protein [Phytohabitans rumicis]GFJ89298.1 hypothetical protein Prum_029400 [Phytohabitans rumicis]
MAIAVKPITGSDVPAVADFLHAQLNSRVSADAWQRAVDVPWKVDAPNHGFMLVDGDAVVGVYLAFYSERVIDGRRERFCNLGAWCVLPEHRFHSLRLLKALLAQEGLHFTDLSPSGNVVPMNTRLKFEFLDTATAIVPALPRPGWFGRGRVSADRSVIEDTLTGDELERYRDHAGTAAARHVVLVRGGEWCYVVFRKDRRKRLPLFASILHVSNPELLHAMSGRLVRHLLFKHGVLATLAELRVVGRRPRLSRMLGSPRRKMFKSASLGPDQIDYLYSELVCVAW